MGKKKIMNCSKCGKEIQNGRKLCKECKKRLLREKIIGENYDTIGYRGNRGIGDLL